ncbi:hypothetical protein GCM10010145_53280 [Streptomyces ruber]|uniref:DUF4232 domain-containing protein n=2 Tax=Streptomyces TaxID=1883 RepID=A0A918BNQ0_9ACTN|nr:DUF4232 domain-containing protein [Streptomyces ruber]GGQ76914.1 hypothetical protein GCM10010145_53280 [Streptomyces ruber]
MRITPTTVTATLVAALALTACGGGGDDGDTAPSGTAADGATGAAAACRADRLTIDFGPSNAAPAAGDTGNIPVTLTNTGDTCTLQGVPATEVHSGGTSWTVGGQEGAAQPELTLDETATASFTITYVRGAAGDPERAVRPERVEFRLPGDDALQSHDWPDAEVALVSAEELEMTVSPFLPAGD